MDWKCIHLIKENNIYLLYHYPTSKLMTINKKYFQISELLKKGTSISEIMNLYVKQKNDIETFAKSIETTFNHEIETKNNISKNNRIIDRITLHVSNDCNLRCKYCYAEGGSYNLSRNMMSIQTAKTFVDFCINSFDKIRRIVFFGGEPLLNIEIMEFICNQFKTYNKTGKYSSLPSFHIITNGTILTNRTIQFIKDNISSVTVSIDGPKEINDINRIDKKGKGSYNRIEEFIHKIIDETNIQIQYEATFTESHINAGFTPKEIKHILENEFRIKGIISCEKDLDLTYLLDELKHTDYKNLIDTNFNDLPEDFWYILDAIIENKSRPICPISNDIFAIGTEGNIYPCHIVNGIRSCNLGNINSENIFNTPKLHKLIQSKIRFKNNRKCKECWAQVLCGGCAVKRFYNEEIKDFTTEPNTGFCELTRQYIEQILIIIATIRKDPGLWSALIEKKKQE